jgi:hypothetical protein
MLYVPEIYERPRWLFDAVQKQEFNNQAKLIEEYEKDWRLDEEDYETAADHLAYFFTPVWENDNEGFHGEGSKREKSNLLQQVMYRQEDEDFRIDLLYGFAYYDNPAYHSEYVLLLYFDNPYSSYWGMKKTVTEVCIYRMNYKRLEYKPYKTRIYDEKGQRLIYDSEAFRNSNSLKLQLHLAKEGQIL